MTKRLVLRVLAWSGLALLVVVITVVLVVLPYWAAGALMTSGTRPMDLELTFTPADFGAEFEEVAFPSTDGVPLRGWYLGAGERGGSVICAHGMFRSRREVLERCLVFREMGFNVLLFDSRRHGESGGDQATFGWKERLDVAGALDLMRTRHDGSRFVLFGVSMGAAASLFAAAERAEVNAVIADSSFLTLEQVVAAYMKGFGLPRFPLGDTLLFFIERRLRVPKEDLNVERAVHQIGDRPILFLGGSEDEQAPPEVQARLFEAAESESSRLVVFEGSTHGAAYRTRPDEYREAVVAFVDTSLPSATRKEVD